MLPKRGELFLTLLPLSFVFRNIRADLGAFTLELWQVVFSFALLYAIGSTVHNKEDIRLFKLDKIGICALFVVVACWLSFYDAIYYKAWLNRSLRLTLMFLMYLYFVNNIKNTRELFVFLRGNIIACFISSIILVFQVLKQFNIGFNIRMDGTFNNPNQGAGYIVLFLFLLLALFPHIKHLKINNNKIYLMIVVICFLSLLVYGSRAPVMALGLISILMLISNKKTRILLLISGVLLTLVWNLSSTQILSNRIKGTFGVSENENTNIEMTMSAIDRMNIANIYWQIIKQKPLFGIGAMNYAYIYKRNDLNINVPMAPSGYFGGNKKYPYDIRNTSAHNIYLSWWAETGIIGLLPFVLSTILSIKYSIKFVHRKNLNILFRALNNAILGMFLMFIIIGMVHDYGTASVRYWLLLSLASIIFRLSKKQKQYSANLF
jgi:O-antigen ligase